MRGKLRNAPQHFAIVLDREIRSWPQIDYTDGALAGGISGNAQITGIGDIQEAKDLALVLQTGALPVEFVTLDQTAISATLGKDSLNQAKTAAIVGLSSSRSSCSSSTASSASSRCSASASTPPSSTPRSSSST